MKAAVAILTYNRPDALRRMLAGALKWVSHQAPMAIFDDASSVSGGWDLSNSVYESAYAADVISHPDGPVVYVGRRNVGVAGNSNRGIRWFLEETDADILFLCNDDLDVLGDFITPYTEATEALGVAHWSFCDFDGESYRGVVVPVGRFRVSLNPRMTGIMMTITREMALKVGFMDPAFGQFGQEHCDWTNRIRFAGGIKLNGVDQSSVDLVHATPVLRHQDVVTSVTGAARVVADAKANSAMRRASEDYVCARLNRPYHLYHFGSAAGPTVVSGIPTEYLRQGYRFVETPA